MNRATAGQGRADMARSVERYVAFLRAINVGGRVVKMDRLRDLFTGLGFSAVETFIASGNVIFETRGPDIPSIEETIERALQPALGYHVAAFVRRARDLAAIAGHEPFAAAGGRPDGTIYIGFLRAAPTAAARRAILSLRTDVDELDVHRGELYWLVRGKLMDSKLSGGALERTLGPTTMRNRNTVVRLAARYGAGVVS